jgi:hypothetical protein
MRIPLLFVAVAGCTNTIIHESPPGESALDAATPDMDASDVTPDGGPDGEQDPNVYPADHHPLPQVDFNSGPVLAHPEIVTVTFNDGAGGAADPFAATAEAFGEFILTSKWWQALTAAGYGVQSGTASHVRIPDTVSNQIFSNAQVQQFIQTEVTGGALPSPTSNTLYVLYYPPSTTITSPGAGTSCHNFGGYHDTTSVSTKSGAVQIAYAVIPRCNFPPDQLAQATEMYASHEIAEATTNPQPNVDSAYYLFSNDAWAGRGGGGEIADICFIGSHYVASGYGMARIYSNGAAKVSQDPCQPTDDVMPAHVYYGAAVRTETVTNPFGHPTDGYAVVPRGTSKDLGVDVFSDAPLPHDLSLQAGASTPTGLLPVAGVTLTLSRTSAHNGNAATLTITVAASTRPGDYPIVVRAMLETTDHEDWPMIVRVK